jgi:hypothetical protein
MRESADGRNTKLSERNRASPLEITDSENYSDKDASKDY